MEALSSQIPPMQLGERLGANRPDCRAGGDAAPPGKDKRGKRREGDCVGRGQTDVISEAHKLTSRAKGVAQW
jgi:hypothetical protein